MAQMTLPGWFKDRRPEPGSKGAVATGFLENNLKRIASFMRSVIGSDEYADRPGLLQGISPKARIGGAFLIIIACSVTAQSVFLLSVLLLSLVAVRLSNVGFKAVLRRVVPAFIFTFALIIPVFFNFVSPGADVIGFTVSGFKVSITREGALTCIFFITRVISMVSVISLVLLTTKQSDLFKGLRGLPVPSFFVTALFISLRYLIVLMRMLEDYLLGLKSRTIKGTSLGQSQAWFSSRAAMILKRSLYVAEEVNMAMVSRGFTGKIKTSPTERLTGRDYLWIGFSCFVLFLSLGV